MRIIRFLLGFTLLLIGCTQNHDPSQQQGTNSSRSVASFCPVSQNNLCSDVAGFGSTPDDYCKYPRLASVATIPTQCPVNSCLLVLLTQAEVPVITVATCWDPAAEKEVAQ